MQLDRTSIVLRPRGPWEAVDLGFRMVQQWWRPIFGAWFAVVIPLAIVLALAFSDSLFWAWAILWWLKPILERIPLYVASEAVFGRVPTIRQTLAAFPRLALRQLPWVLTFYRLAPARSFTMPVILLEGLSGRAQAERIRTLRWRAGGAPSTLTFVCVHIEGLVLYYGLMQLVSIFLPESFGFGRELFPTTAGSGAGLLNFAVYVGAVSAMAPFYAVAGFSLYIHRRVYLEGWDIDLAFRNLARRAAAAGAVALALLVGANSARAEVLDPSEASRIIAEVMQEDELRQSETRERWVLRDFDGVEEQEASEPLDLSWLAGLAWWILWITVAIGVLLLIRLIAQLIPEARARAAAGGPPERSDTVAGFDIRPESLPPDLVASARAAWAEGRVREALALLYRGALSYLVHERELDLGASATEGECLRAAAELDDVLDDFTRLTRSWQGVAYARRVLEAAAFDELCERWGGRLTGGAA